MNILNKAVLVKLSISQYNPRRTDDKITREVIDNHGAKRDAGIWVKNVIDPKTLSGVGNSAVKIRSTHYRLSLPWADDGVRILPTTMYTVYQDEMRKCKKEFDANVTEFINKYPQYVEEARKALNGMFNESDYPGIMTLREKFGIAMDFRPLPSGSDFRVTLAKDDLADMQQNVDKRVHDAVNDAMKDLWQRLAQPIRHMIERLKDPDTVFRNTIVDNLKEIIDVIPSLNIVDDKELTAMVKECKEKLLKHTPEDLREVKEIRIDVKNQAEKLLKKMEGYI
jgi:hypothetical protein